MLLSPAVSRVILACAFGGGEKNPTVTFPMNPSTAFISSRCNSVNKKGMLLSKHHTCSWLLLGITQFTGKHCPHTSKVSTLPSSF